MLGSGDERMNVKTILGMLVGLSLCGGCTTVTTDDNNPFGSGPTAPATSQPTSSSNGSESTGEGDSTSNDGGDSTSDGGDDTTTSATATTTGPLGTTTDMTAGESSSDGGGGNGMQPAMGMYSHCVDPAECAGGVNLCITVNGDGFCTLTGCANPLADCDPNPGGTATPVCVSLDVGGMNESACALDCTGGGTCPPPMTCVGNLQGLRDLCV